MNTETNEINEEQDKKEHILDVVFRLTKALTKEQKEDILTVCDECQRIGADSYHLAPFFAIAYLSSAEPSQEDLNKAEELISQILKNR